jgi:hypothetical protein
MLRGVIVGAIAFAVAFAAERVYEGMKGDLARYNALRKMSGEEPLGSELLSLVTSLLTGSTQKDGVGSFISEMTEDVVRYAKIRGM